VEGIVHQSEGQIRIRSTPGEGTGVEVYLPRRAGARAAEAASTAGADGETSPASGRTILLVEDDDMVRRLAGRSLRGAGYQVFEAADGNEALEVFAGSADAFDLVLTDMVMPRRGGLELARELRTIRPDVPLIFMSGYPNPREDQDMDMPPGEELIQKPFSPAALRARVAEVLRRSA
jgi:two-component system cell cycle sensor histidine kinase/response regulator CckA